jgi:hypothetical protein
MIAVLLQECDGNQPKQFDRRLHMKFFIFIVCAYLALTIPTGFGQSMESISGLSSYVNTGRAGDYSITYTVTLPAFPRTILTGHPYSGEEIHQQSQKLPDGTSLPQQMPSAILYRDSAGRSRTERAPFQPFSANQIKLPVVAEIWDPVAGYVYYLDPVNKIAHRMVMPRESVRIQQTPPPALSPGTTTGPNSTTTIEPLGTKVLEGVEAQGRRLTMSYAAGVMGNDRPITVNTEVWISPDLGFTILSKSSNPLTGENISAVINISRAEPDPALFQIPKGYKLQDEQTIPFGFTISNSSIAQ